MAKTEDEELPYCEECDNDLEFCTCDDDEFLSGQCPCGFCRGD